jgi:hypothetical protein
MKGDPIEGAFYSTELQLVDSFPESEKRIEEILKSKVVDGKKMVLVKYKRLPKLYNEWILETDLKRQKDIKLITGRKRRRRKR